MELAEIMQTIQVQWVKEFGRIFRTWLGMHAAVHISSPISAEVIFEQHIQLKTIHIKFYFISFRKFCPVKPLLTKGKITTS